MNGKPQIKQHPDPVQTSEHCGPVMYLLRTQLFMRIVRVRFG